MRDCNNPTPFGVLSIIMEGIKMVAPVIVPVAWAVGSLLIGVFVGAKLHDIRTRRVLSESLHNSRENIREKVQKGEFENKVYDEFCRQTYLIEDNVSTKNAEAIEELWNRTEKYLRENNIDPFELLKKSIEQKEIKEKPKKPTVKNKIEK